MKGQKHSTVGRSEGRKYDEGKPRWSLLPYRALADVVLVLEYGAKLHAPDNWKLVENGERRYLDAAQRHLAAVFQGETMDPESGLPHLAHLACSALFALWHQQGGDDA